MDNWFKSKWFVRAVSLSLAIVLYMFVQVEIGKYQNDSRIDPNGNSQMQTIENVPVNIRIDQERYVVSGVPEKATIQLEGSDAALKATVLQKNFDIFVDLQELGEGTHTVELQHTGIPKELNVYIEPKTIEVTIEERVSKEFNIAVDFINMDKLPEGYELGDPQVAPGKVTITSSNEVIEQVAIVKVFVDVADTKTAIDSREVPVNVYDSQGNELNVNVEPVSVAVSVDVSNPSKKVPVSILTAGEPPEGYSLASLSSSLKEVEIFATSENLSEIKEIKTKEVKLSDLKESGTVDVGLQVPDGAAIPNTDTVKVTVELEKSKKITDITIDIENLQEGKTVSFVEPEEPSMTITVAGEESKIKKLTAKDFHAVVDASDLDEGEHTVAVNVEGPDEDIETQTEVKEVTINIT